MPPKAASSAAPKAKAAPSDHASYQDMIIDAIINLKERNGSSRIQLKKYLKANNKINASDSMFDSLFNRALKAGVAKEVFIMPKGSSGTVKLAPKAKKAPADKPKKAATEKKTTEKKPAVKKAAPKKATATKEPKEPKEKKEKTGDAAAKPKAAPKKAAAKPKAAATKEPKEPKEKKASVAKPKKAAAPKAAPAVVENPTVLKKTASGRVTKTKSDGPKKAAAPKKTATKKTTPKKAAA
ncbi:hypothetical protein sscle_12g087770 [Sclerotinia sclerotiorum 1980 UF-70]|uniref:Histone H1 n=1 Tax=Sclerotinia sclerotiorum (strain ATCC 18683 / 1980 / Ss-1) TaxID=665079 RepID=A0A1D9QGE0_SCLS1|nr:hypothetical protein sscle_12g087770 [Sclerotinia sclerotiorum 1980 UF-70]